MEITEKKSDNVLFSDYLNNTRYEDYFIIRSRIINECRINDQIFRNWKNGYSKIPELAKEKIEQIAGISIF